jgi:hypothetical protein
MVRCCSPARQLEARWKPAHLEGFGDALLVRSAIVATAHLLFLLHNFFDAFHSGLPTCVLLIAESFERIDGCLRRPFGLQVLGQDRYVVVEPLKILSLNRSIALQYGSGIACWFWSSAVNKRDRISVNAESGEVCARELKIYMSTL